MRILTVILSLLWTATAAGQFYEYDDAGRLVRVAYRAGGGVGYAYDDADRMTAAMPLELPATPGGIQVTRTSTTEARVSWQASAAAQGYAVERRIVGSTEWERIATLGPGATMFVDTDLVAGVEYEYRIAAVGPDGVGAFSDGVSTEAAPGGGEFSRLVPRVAAGATFATQFQIINLTDEAANYRIAIYGSSGQPLALRFAGLGGISGLSELNGTVPAAGGFFAQTFPIGATQAGYAVVEQGAESIALTTSITQLVPDRDPFQASVSLAAEPPLSRFPFINTRPFTTVMALTNAAADAQNVELIARGPEGAAGCTSNLSLGAGAHDAFAIQDRLACAANSGGVVEVKADGGGVGPVSFVFHDFGPFTTNLPVAPGDLGATRNVIPRIATGDAFETFFQITNLGESPTAYRIGFYGENGSPLSVPMANEAGQPTGMATSISGTVPAGGLRTARTLASGSTIAGYALVETGAGDVAVNTTISQFVPDRDPFQASAPLIEAVTAARLPFDNRRPFTTVMALTNPAGGASRVTLIARSLAGEERCRDSQDLAGLSHAAFALRDRLACTADSEGVLEIQAEGGGVAPLSFIFHDFGPFTTNLPNKVR